jgi:hypothetical protein
MLKITSLQEMYQSTEYQGYISDRLGNDLFINDPKRADRIYKAAEDGGDGSTHAEVIEDWRDYLNMLKVYDPECDEPEDQARRDITLSVYDSISHEIDECEEWHSKNGSLYHQIG